MAVFLVSDLPEQAIEALEPSKPAAALEGVLSVDDCLTVIYRSEPTRLWDQGVRVARRESAEDPEFVASEAATRVCDKPPRSSELPGKYLSRVASGARDHRRTRSRRAQLLRKCEVPWLDQPATEDRDCVMQVICGMEPDRREVLELFLEGHDDKAMAARLGIGVAAATKRRQRAVDELSKIAREDCR